MKTKTNPNATLGAFREENQVSKLLRHASIQMTERYAHLAPDHLHDAVASIKFSAHFQHTNNSEQNGASENGLKAVENGGRGWI